MRHVHFRIGAAWQAPLLIEVSYAPETRSYAACGPTCNRAAATRSQAGHEQPLATGGFGAGRYHGKVGDRLT